MSDDIEQLNIAVEKLEAAENNPMLIFKAAFSHLPVILLIGSGIALNWILALVFFVGNITVMPFTTILISLLILVILFPAGYFYAVYTYGQQAFVYETYKEILRPVLGNLIAKVLNKLLGDDSTTISSTNIQEEIKKESGSFLDKIPAFIKDRLAIFTVINDITQLASERYQNGGSKETAKGNIVTYIFELLDARMGTIANPSLKTFFIIGGINILAVFFIF
jgi:hypothetical protein